MISLKRIFFLIISLLILHSRPLWAAVTDNSDFLIIPAGETYVLSGIHSYSKSIEISGTLSVRPYDGSTSSGWIELSAATMTVAAGGKIHANGSGYRAGEGPGAGRDDAYGSGAGFGGIGGRALSANGGGAYGSFTMPSDMGSGGGSGRYSGGSGGGRIKVSVSDTLTVNGTISADGVDGQTTCGGGSGGSVWLTSDRFAGNGLITVNGGMSGDSKAGGGAGGRIAVYFNQSAFSGSMTAYVKPGSSREFYTYAAPGTVYQKSTNQVYGDLLIASNNKPFAATPLSGRYSSVTITRQSTVISTAALFCGNLVVSDDSSFVQSGDQLYASNLSVVNISSMVVEAAGNAHFSNVTVDRGSVLDNKGSCEVSGITTFGSTSTFRNTGARCFAGNASVQGGSLIVSSSSFSADQFTASGNVKVYNYNSFIVNNNLELSNATFYHLGSQMEIKGTAHVGAESVLWVDNPVTANSLRVSGMITHSPLRDQCRISARDLTINASGRIDAGGKGYKGSNGENGVYVGDGPGGGGWSRKGGGGGYGGIGGTGRMGVDVGSGGISYGSMVQPADFGSGGGWGAARGATGGNGGGKIVCQISGTMENNGVIAADGYAGSGDGAFCGGGGSGGTVYIVADHLQGSGKITANGGGNVTVTSSGGGAGGRIALYCKSSSFSGSVEVNAGPGGSPAGQPGTIMPPLSGGAESAVSVSNTPLTYTASKSLGESVRIRTAQCAWNAEGTLRGSVNVTTMTIVTVQTGGFANQGFCNGQWTATLEAVEYKGQIYGMTYLNANDGNIYFRGVMEGIIDGSVEGCFSSGFGGDYTQFNGTWTFRLGQSGGVLSCGVMRVNGPVSCSGDQTYSDVALQCSQASTNGTLTGGYTGALNTVLTLVRIDDARVSCSGEGFCSLNYQWDALRGPAGGYVKAIEPGKLELKTSFAKPLLGTAAGLVQDNGAERSIWFVFTRLDIGQEPQPELSVNLISSNRLSPGQPITYSVEVINNGARAARNVKIILNLPPQVRFVSADGDYYYHNACEWDTASYAGPEEAPESVSWEIPEVPNRSVITFNAQGSVSWGTSGDVEAEVGLYEYHQE